MKEKIEKFRNYISEVRIEINNVTWPTKNDLINLTIVVISLSIMLAIFVGVIDLSFVKLIMHTIK